jgi:hypothetical protein
MTHPDFRALCAELLAECRSLRSANPANLDLWDRARAALAAEPGEGASLSSLVRYGVTWDGRKTTPLLTPMPDGYWTPWHIAVECTHPAPVPVAERPWDRNGWCTDNGHCWLWDAFASRWIHRHHTASRLIEVDFTLPHWALPLPEAQP